MAQKDKGDEIEFSISQESIAGIVYLLVDLLGEISEDINQLSPTEAQTILANVQDFLIPYDDFFQRLEKWEAADTREFLLINKTVELFKGLHTIAENLHQIAEREEIDEDSESFHQFEYDLASESLNHKRVKSGNSLRDLL